MKKFEWPDDGKLAFAIRDDDVSYFTQPWMLDVVYGEAWKLGFKVSLAVIPCVKATKLRLVPHHLRENEGYFPISENKELVDYLREKIASGCVDIIQHGYSHEKKGEKPEFASRDYGLLDQKLKSGRTILERTLKRDVKVFAAPHERVSRAAMKTLHQNEVSLCRKFTAGRFLLTAPDFWTNFERISRVLLFNPNPFGPIKDKIIFLEKMLIIQWQNFLMGRNIDEQIVEAKSGFLESLSNGDPFVIAQHYWEYFDSWSPDALRKRRLERFNEFLRFVASKEKVWKAGLSEIADWAKAQDENNSNG